MFVCFLKKKKRKCSIQFHYSFTDGVFWQLLSGLLPRNELRGVFSRDPRRKCVHTSVSHFLIQEIPFKCTSSLHFWFSTRFSTWSVVYLWMPPMICCWLFSFSSTLPNEVCFFPFYYSMPMGFLRDCTIPYHINPLFPMQSKGMWAPNAEIWFLPGFLSLPSSKDV